MAGTNRWAFEVERISRPQPGCFGYTFPWNYGSKDYDTSSYNAEHSDHRISKADVLNMMERFKKCALYSPIHDPAVLRLIPCLLILDVLLFSLLVLAYWNKDEAAFSGAMFFFFIVIAVILCAIVGIAQYVKRTGLARLQTRSKEMVLIAEQVRTQVFANLPVYIKLPPLGSYLAIEFRWKVMGGGVNERNDETVIINEEQKPLSGRHLQLEVEAGKGLKSNTKEEEL